jgi:hypothetical protein
MKRRMLWLIVVATFLCGMAEGQQALDNAAITKMHEAGLGDDTIVAVINSQPGSYTLGVNEVLALKSAGLGDKVISAMASKLAPAAAPAAVSAPVSTTAASGAAKGGGPSVYFQSDSASGDQSDESEMAADFKKYCPAFAKDDVSYGSDYVIEDAVSKMFRSQHHQFTVEDSNSTQLYQTHKSESVDDGMKNACDVIKKDWAGKHAAK